MESHAWREAQELATAVLGENSRLFPAQCGSYSGVIIGVTDQYVLQRITWRSAVAHDKEVLDRFPTVGERVRVRYQGDAGRIERIQG